MTGAIREVCRNVKYERDPGTALRWTSAAMLEWAKRFRKLEARKQSPALRAALLAHQAKPAVDAALDEQAIAA